MAEVPTTLNTEQLCQSVTTTLAVIANKNGISQRNEFNFPLVED